MIAGLPLQSWVLIVLSVGLGLGLELSFYRFHRKRTRWEREGPPRPSDAPPTAR